MGEFDCLSKSQQQRQALGRGDQNWLRQKARKIDYRMIGIPELVVFWLVLAIPVGLAMVWRLLKKKREEPLHGCLIAAVGLTVISGLGLVIFAVLEYLVQQ
ncbi:MAG: hypothetical protein ACI9DF_005895 [Verrucomicrobiales bacterium]